MENPDDYQQRDQETRELGSNALKQSETSFYHRGNSAEATNKSGLYKAEGAKKSGSSSISNSLMTTASPLGKALSFVKKHQKGAIVGGGGLTGLVIGIVLLFGFIASHFLLTLQKDMLRYEDKSVSYVLKKAGDSLLSHAMCRSLSGSALVAAKCGVVNSGEGDTNTNGQPVEDPLDPMTSELDSLNFTNPAVDSALAGQGIDVNKSGGKLVGLEDANSGSPITYNELANPASSMATEASSALPVDKVGELTTMEPELQTDVQANFDPIPSDQSANPERDYEDSVSDVPSGGSIDPTAATEQNNVTKNESASNALDGQATADASNSVLSAADNAIANGGTESTAIKAADKAAGLDTLGKGLIITAIVGTFCSIDKAATNGALSRLTTITGDLIRSGTTLASVASEMTVGGSMSGQQISKVTSMFLGKSADASSKIPSVAQGSLSATQSAAWQRITGNPVDTNPNSPGYNPDISQAALPVQNAGGNIVNEFNKYLTLTGGSLVCDLVDNSITGHILSFLGVVATAGIDIGSLGSSDVAIAGASMTFSEFAKHYLVPKIVQYFTPVAVNGLESAVQMMNNADAGSNLMFNLFAQRLGGSPLNTSTASALAQKGGALQQISQSHQSFFDRTLAFSNPSSLASRLLVDLPLSKIGMITSFLGDIVRAPLLLMHALGDLIGGAHVLALSTNTAPGEAYGFTQYGFNPNDITKYDPINNEYFLTHTSVTFDNNSQTLINLLGNPNNYPNGEVDPNTNDLFHCFAMPPSEIGNEIANMVVDPICGTMGNFDTTDLKPVGIQLNGVANMICVKLNAPSNLSADCQNTVSSFLSSNNVIKRYQQYVLDDQVAGYYASLMNGG